MTRKKIDIRTRYEANVVYMPPHGSISRLNDLVHRFDWFRCDVDVRIAKARTFCSGSVIISGYDKLDVEYTAKKLIAMIETQNGEVR